MEKLPKAQCDNCILKNHQVVPGSRQGNNVLVIGESPTLEDTEAGQPLTGRQGKELLLALAGRKVDFTYSVPCFVGGDRDALRKIRLKASKTGLGDPVSCCRPRLMEETSSYQNIILLGKTALEAVTHQRSSILDKRGFGWRQGNT